MLWHSKLSCWLRWASHVNISLSPGCSTSFSVLCWCVQGSGPLPFLWETWWGSRLLATAWSSSGIADIWDWTSKWKLSFSLCSSGFQKTYTCFDFKNHLKFMHVKSLQKVHGKCVLMKKKKTNPPWGFQTFFFPTKNKLNLFNSICFPINLLRDAHAGARLVLGEVSDHDHDPGP